MVLLGRWPIRGVLAVLLMAPSVVPERAVVERLATAKSPTEAGMSPVELMQPCFAGLVRRDPCVESPIRLVVLRWLWAPARLKRTAEGGELTPAASVVLPGIGLGHVGALG